MIELDRHIEILLLTNDCVIIPGFGGFMAHYEEARKDERDSAFLPPMRTVGFNPKLTLNDSLLAQSYVEVHDISYPDALSRIEDEVRELRQHLEHERRYEMNGIGVLSLNEEGNYEFEPCSSGILTPSLYGLGYYEMKTVEQLEKELLKSIKTDEADAETADTPSALMNLGDEQHNAKVVALWRAVAVACIAFVAFLLIPTPLANTDRQMTMSRVDTRLLDYVMPKDKTTGEAEVREVVKKASMEIDRNAAKAAASKQQPAVPSFTLVLASRVTKKNAAEYVARLHKRGLDQAAVESNGKMTRVVCGDYSSQEEATKALRRMHQDEEFKQAWILKR